MKKKTYLPNTYVKGGDATCPSDTTIRWLCRSPRHAELKAVIIKLSAADKAATVAPSPTAALLLPFYMIADCKVVVIRSKAAQNTS